MKTFGRWTGVLVVVAVASGGALAATACTSNDDAPASSTDAGTGALYTRLGGHAGIRNAVNAVVAEELKDPEIASFFANVGTPGHPTADQIEECFTNLLGKISGGPESYPTTANGFMCRDMRTAHAALHIPGSTFDKFVVIAAGVLKGAGVADADIATIGGALNGTKTDIVDPSAVSDAGAD